MMTMNPPLPPPSESAIAAAFTLLAVAADPAAAKARLEELVGQLDAIRAEREKAEAAQQAVEDAQRGLADLVEREQAVTKLQLQTEVASAAVAKREQGLDAREVGLAKGERDLNAREAEIAGKEKALADRIEAYRAALA